VKGRQAHPPKSEKNIVKEIPKKERRLALFSAIAATASKQAVVSRGHHIEDVVEIPLVVANDFESLSKTKEAEEALIRLGVLSEIFKAKHGTKIRAGKGKSRGRKMKRPVGPLIVVGENKGVIEATRNIPGVDAAMVSDLNVELLAPGTHPGRLTVWTCGAIEKLGEFYGKGEEE
jgi:large subunit ribosomal protein L4e